MGLNDLIAETGDVFTFLSDMYVALPPVIQLLILASCGGVIYIAVLHSIWR